MNPPHRERRCGRLDRYVPPPIRYAPGVDPRLSPAEQAEEIVKIAGAAGDAATLSELLGFDVALDYAIAPGMVHIRRADQPTILFDDPDPYAGLPEHPKAQATITPVADARPPSTPRGDSPTAVIYDETQRLPLPGE